jgi:hypothetical protein
MQSKKTKLIIGIIIAISLGIAIYLPIFTILISNNTPRNYGQLDLAFQVQEKETPYKIVQTTNFTLKVQYNEFQREHYNEHLQFIFEINQTWYDDNYTLTLLWKHDTVQDHYWMAKLDDNVLFTMCCGIMQNGSYELHNGNYFNLTRWELGTGPDPSITCANKLNPSTLTILTGMNFPKSPV